jgi:hypothetical protein
MPVHPTDISAALPACWQTDLAAGKGEQRRAYLKAARERERRRGDRLQSPEPFQSDLYDVIYHAPRNLQAVAGSWEVRRIGRSWP